LGRAKPDLRHQRLRRDASPPWGWDLKRPAASAVGCARYLGGDAGEGEAAAPAAVQAYRTAMPEEAQMGHLSSWDSRIEEDDILSTISGPSRRYAKKLIKRARGRTHLQVLGKMTDLVDDQQRIHESRPLIVRETMTEGGRPIAEALTLFLQSYLGSIAEDR